LERPTLLLIRPKQASERFAAQFRARYGADWPVVIAPLMRTAWLNPKIDADAADGVIFTSETAVQAFVRHNPDRRLQAWCVGPRTAQTANDAGFCVVQGPGDAPGLVRTILDGGRGIRLLYVHGVHVAHDIEKMLSSAGIETISVTAYDQRPLALSSEARGLLRSDGPVILPLFSRRSARLIATQVGGDCAAPIWIAALSPEVAELANDLKPAKLLVSIRPDSEAMLEVMQHFANPAALA
jgi:uroporphyrinogen-III synthase